MLVAGTIDSSESIRVLSSALIVYSWAFHARCICCGSDILLSASLVTAVRHARPPARLPTLPLLPRPHTHAWAHAVGSGRAMRHEPVDMQSVDAGRVLIAASSLRGTHQLVVQPQ